MKLRFAVVLYASACLVLVGCGKKEPGGQVAATVNGKEITVIDLRNEMNGFSAPDAKTRKLAEQAALDQIITRKLLVGAAKKQKLDQSPEFVQQKEKVDETLLVRFWQTKVAKSVPAPSKDEVDRYVAAHPELYSSHRVFVIDQIRMQQVNDPTLPKQLSPLKTLPEVAQLLTTKKIPFQQGQVEIDSLRIDPRLVAAILNVPAEDVFAMPDGNLLLINKVRETRIDSVPADAAAKHAKQVLISQRTQETVQRELGGVLARARAEKDAVKYAKGYGPPAKPKAASAASPGRPAAAPASVAPAAPGGLPAAPVIPTPPAAPGTK